MPLSYDCYGVTHVGKVRGHNEDGFVAEGPGIGGLHLLAVADGMARHAGGEHASRTTLEAVRQTFAGMPLPPAPAERVDALLAAFDVAQAALERLVTLAPDLTGTGTTLVAALLASDGVAYQHAGDSRLYWLRGGDILHRSRDHSVVQTLIELGQLRPEQAASHPMAGQLVSCVTADRPMAATQVSPTLEEGAWFVPHAGDVILLCSDGVTGELPEPELTSLACGSGKAAERCEAIVAAVLATPARDNASVVVAVVGGSA